MLRAFILTLNYDSGRKMRNTHCRGRLIYMLTSRAAGTICVDLQIIVIDLYINIFLYIRNHIAGCK